MEIRHLWSVPRGEMGRLKTGSMLIVQVRDDVTWTRLLAIELGEKDESEIYF